MPDEVPGTRSVWRGVARETAVLVFFVVLSILMTWPLAANLDRAVSDPGDPLLNTWIMEWTWHSLTHDPANFWNAPIFHPLRYTIAFSENLLGITIPLFPLYAAGLKPLVVYNIALLLGFAFSGYGAYVLGRLVSGSTGAGVAAGIFYAFLPFRFDQIAHVQHVWSGWIPLAVAALVCFVRRPGWRNALLLALALLFNGLSNGHWLLFAGAAIGLGVVTLAVLTGRWDRRFWLPLAAAIGLTYGAMYVFLQPYGTAGEMYGMRRWAGEAAHFSAVPSDWFSSGRYNRFYGGTSNWDRGERALFPGAIGLLLASMSILMLRRKDLEQVESCEFGAPSSFLEGPRIRRVVVALDVLCVAAFVAMAAGFADRGELNSPNEEWKQSAVPAVILVVAALVRLWIAYPRAWGGPERSFGKRIRESRFSPEIWLSFLFVAMGYFGSLGMNSFFHQFLYSYIAPFRSLRVPARWAMIAYVGLAMLVAVGVVALAGRFREKHRPALVVLVSLVLLFELRAAPIRWGFFDATPAPVHEWLVDAPEVGAVLELPVAEDWSEYRYLHGATLHHRPILNGVSGYPTKLHEEVRQAFLEDPVPSSLIDRLERVGCGLIVVHNDKYATQEPVRRWLKSLSKDGRLMFIRRFDHGAGGDYVFAITKIVPNAVALRAPERPDPSGRAPLENARIFLDENGRTYNATAFGWLDVPKFNWEVTGELDVSGWALSPHGISEVRLSLENGAVSMPAERYDWETIRVLYPWYPKTDLTGFRLTIPERPDGVSLVTDLLVEIVDEEGSVTPLDQVFIEWHPRKPVRGLDFASLAVFARGLGLESGSVDAIAGGDPGPLVSRLVEENRARSDDEFLDAVFAALLNRGTDDEARHNYRTRLERGGKRRDIIEAILNSKEFRGRMDKMTATSP